MSKRSVEISFNTLAILIIVLIVLVAVILYYFLVYSRGTASSNQIVITVTNQTNQTQEIIRNMTNLSLIN